MHPELVGKKVVTEDGLEIGEISEIKADAFGSVIAIISTRYEDFPTLEVPVISLRRKESGKEVSYIIPKTKIPLQLLNRIEHEARAKEISVEEKVELIEAPEVPPLEKFREEKVEEIEIKEEIKEVEEPTPEVVGREVIEEREEEKRGFLSFLMKIIEAIKRLFRRK